MLPEARKEFHLHAHVRFALDVALGLIRCPALFFALHYTRKRIG